MMPLQPSDIALFLVSFAACIYCAILSRRLKALQNTRNGLGATIRAMSESVAAVSSARNETQTQAKEIAVRLSALLQEASEATISLSELKHAIEVKEAETSRRYQSAEADLRKTMRDAVTQSGSRIMEIKQLIERLETLTGRAVSNFNSSEFLFDEEEQGIQKKVYESYGQKR
ncbi:hypothetical protein [Hyphomonas pacifica]|uniref:DNA recombination protein RmuC homolog n=1 Tax=Hyphomonas pacifica TaxID=1280941 RepID=A0A062U7V1_9PROT|nr:hypothetical protein [Hyphomonas pacifica]KCZ52215.1 hypothetical protein HY2_09365 [Hyphomonas pacifica]RAN35069.1 hypothetical protein HY3_09495 [Hyphomonas pacifica]